MALSAKKIKCIDGYLSGKSKVQAMLDAGYSPSTSQSKHSTIFGDPKVIAEIERRQKIASTRSGVSLEWIVDRLKSIADANLGDLIDIAPDGSIRMDYEKLTPDLRRALSGVNIDEYTEGRGPDKKQVKRIKINLADKLRALELLMRHLGLSKEKIIVGVEDDLVERLQRGKNRVVG